MNKSLHVTVSFEFPNIDDPDTDAVSELLELLQEDLEQVCRAQKAAAVWVDDAVIVSGGKEVA